MAVEATPRHQQHPIERWRFTVDEYYRLAETGILPPDARVELIDGEVIKMAPIGPGHGGHVKRGIRTFSRALGDRALLSVQDTVNLGAGVAPEPDLVLLRPRADDYTESNPTADSILLIVEVSDSSLAYDRQEKVKLYAQAGIEDYWIVNLVQRQVEVHREPFAEGYRSVQILKHGDTIQLLAFPDVTIAVADILG